MEYIENTFKMRNKTRHNITRHVLMGRRLIVVFNDQIRPPTKIQKEEKLAILNNYAFNINQVPHVFGEYCFVGHKHKYME